MKRNLHSRLTELRRTGEVKTGRRLAEALETDRIKDLFPGESREEITPFGRCYLREQKIPLAYRHGKGTLEGVLDCRGGALVLPARDGSMENFNPCRSLFLDIETTGLAGGTGTWAFLIGLGWLDENHFKLRQYFMRRPAEERAILNHFTETAAAFPSLVTFNGKLFDLPLIQTRQLLSGFKHTEPLQHLDLLQCARILWRKRLPSRSLHALEEALLGLQRINDIPGAEIPAVYFDYLRRGKTARIKQVFYHNTLDILSMVALLDRVYRLSIGDNLEHPAEALALGRLCLKAGRTAEGIAYLQKASESGLKEAAEEAALELSLHFKQQNEWEKASALWREIIRNNPSNSRPYIELAKYYEHRRGDFEAALKLTRQALTLSSKSANSATSGELSRAALEHRLARLTGRLRTSVKTGL